MRKSFIEVSVLCFEGFFVFGGGGGGGGGVLHAEKS